ncbi:MAG TPA: hypothetical protein VMP01_25440 [Pirellulaceae bacterium]|nr:hypothetical protein [Pirellulaceae bacterium]
MKRICLLLACVAFPWLAAGCNSTAPEAEKKADSGEAAKHAHGEGPHGGTITDWGGGAYHVEFTVDHDKKEATVYILGGDEKTPAPIKAESIQLAIDDPMTELELKAQPLDGEPEGSSSRFVGTHDTIGIVKEFSGTISGQVEGTPYTGDFKEEPHGADHKH